jgi:HK97 gp10 family phage protein
MTVERTTYVDVSGFVKTLGELTVEEAAAAIEGKAVVLAPVDTGNLRSSMYRRPSGRGHEVGNTAEYAVYQEFGTVNTRAQPFLIPALDEVRKQLRKIARNQSGEAYARNKR